MKERTPMKRKSLWIVLCAVFLLTACSVPRLDPFSTAVKPLQEVTLSGTGKDKILLISVSGMISTAPKKGVLTTSPSLVEQVVIELEKAKNDKSIKAVVLKINSSGGTITASDILYKEIAGYKEKSGSKVAVIMMDVAASGAYYISLPADMIMAHPTTVTGSIGVIFIRPKVNTLMEKVGIGVEISKFGSLKDMGSPYRPTTEKEKDLIQKTVDAYGKRFIDLVVKHRKVDATSIAEISTARVFIADEALRLGLIDKIGYIADTVKETKLIAGLPDDAKVVVYRRQDIPEDNYYRTALAEPQANGLSLISITLPDIFTAGAGFYYLWPEAIHFD